MRFWKLFVVAFEVIFVVQAAQHGRGRGPPESGQSNCLQVDRTPRGNAGLAQALSDGVTNTGTIATPDNSSSYRLALTTQKHHLSQSSYES